MQFQNIILPLLSSLVMMLALFFCVPALGLVGMVPLLFSLQNTYLKLFIQKVAIFSAVYTSFLFFWMLSSSVQFTGDIGYGVFGMVFSVLLFSLLFTGVFLIWRKLSRAVLDWKTIIVLAALFVLMEFACDYLFKTLPWYNHHFGTPLIGGVYTIQLAEIGGVYILTFFVYVFNGGIAYGLKEKRQFKVVASVAVVFFVGNILLFKVRTKGKYLEKEIKVNLLNANVKPLTNWETQGNELVPKILALSKQNDDFPSADLNVWTESLVPWTYQKDDDFVNAILKSASKKQIINLIGMNTDFAKNAVLNSAYVLQADGTILGRYDKVHPLSFMERPFKSSSTIQFANNGCQVEAGNDVQPIETKLGKIGVYICNETSIASSVLELVKNGADFLVNISNDGWIKSTYIARQHFYYNRLRAVENRRDIAFNSNCGYSGKATANGEILKIDQSDIPTIHQVSLNKESIKTIYTYYPNAFVLIITLLTSAIILFKKL